MADSITIMRHREKAVARHKTRGEQMNLSSLDAREWRARAARMRYETRSSGDDFSKSACQALKRPI
jgi:hypothetical protein